MKNLFGTYLALFLLLTAQPLAAQVDTTRTDTTTAPADTVDALDPVEQVAVIHPWLHRSSLQEEPVSSDSTLRWQVWPGWVDKKNRDPGVITYRLGTQVRTNAMLIDAHEPRYQLLYWENVRLNDPVSGTVNWSFIPLQKSNKLYEEDDGLHHSTRFVGRQYYLNRPLSRLSFSESKFDFRNMEFMVSQNIGQETNTELSYRSRRGGGAYSNSEIQGQQIYARISHNLDNRQLLKANFLNNSYTIGEPFGYQIPDLANFDFDRFATQPSQTMAESEVSGSTLSLNYYRRKQDTLSVPDDMQAGIFFNNRKRSLEAVDDTASYKVQSMGGNLRKWMDLDILALEGHLMYEHFFNKNAANVQIDDWGVMETGVDAVFKPLDLIELRSGAEISRRTDGYNAYKLNAESILRMGSVLELKAGLAQGSKMPTIQQLYWSSDLYSGNSSLQNEQVREVHAGMSLRLAEPLKLGIRGQLKEIDRAVMVDIGNNNFTNLSRYNSVSVTPYFDFNSTHFELEGSATYHRFGDYTGASVQPLPVDPNKRIWMKGSAYIKGYLFDRATFVKAGLSGMMAPFRYQAERYHPMLDFWQPISDDQYLPVFNRLDVDISARVRSIMVLLRWENVLDDVAQRGYFETAGYPMSERRFIFGIRVLFRN